MAPKGRKDHTSKLDFDADLMRRNGSTAAGLAMVQVTWDMAENHPDEFVAELRWVRADQLRRLA